MILFGLVTWLVPFIVSFLFFDVETQTFRIGEIFFKSIMIVLSGIVGVILLVYYFKGIDKGYLREGIAIGLIWFGINCVLDLVLLLPMSGMAIGPWFAEIGMRYLMAPIMSIGFGYALEKKG